MYVKSLKQPVNESFYFYFQNAGATSTTSSFGEPLPSLFLNLL